MGKSKEEIDKIISQMTVEEKVAITTGKDVMTTKGLERLGIPEIHLCDGPHGLRKQEGEQDFLGINPSITATCFPASCLTGAGFDPKLTEQIGQALGEICQAKDVQVILGPGINHKRNPLCGRNFEYFSEEPLVSAKLGTAYVKGAQSKGIGVSLKHFVANSQETRRRTSSSNMDERTFREIYTPAFEYVVKNAKPLTVMSSYNKVNGTYVNEREDLCKNLLRNQWGFDGLLVSDWNAVHDRVAAFNGGTELTMPCDDTNNQKVVDAVNAGEISMEKLDQAVFHILNLVFQTTDQKKENAEYDFEKAHEMARKIAAECMVLLKNEDEILPLDPRKKIAIIGSFTTEPRFQGAGSSKVQPYKVLSMPEVTKDYENIRYAEGFQQLDERNLVKEEVAITLAKESDICIILAGLPAMMEGEGYDRWTMKLPICQNVLIEEICKVQPNTVVVLENGGAVELPWITLPKAVLEAYLPGEAVNEAIFDALTGVTAPSGHLAETFPVKLEDHPAYLSAWGDGNTAPYQEGVFTGYRYYTTKKMPVRYPFAYGLTYTEFSYSNLQISANHFCAGDTLHVQADVKNVGKRPGKALVQLYVGAPLTGTGVHRPIRELKGFEKVELQVGETKTVEFLIDKRGFAFFDAAIHDYRLGEGDFTINIGTDANTMVLSAPIHVEEEFISGSVHFDMLSTIGEVQRHPAGKMFFHKYEKVIDMITKKMAGPDVEKMPYFHERPKETGLLSEPMQTARRMLPMVGEEEWKQLFENLNQS